MFLNKCIVALVPFTKDIFRKQNVNARLASTYKAAVVEKQGKSFKLVELKPPKKLKNGQVRIKVRACALNAFDYLITQGLNPGTFTYPVTPGYEISGEVMEINNCKEIRKGDKIVALNKDTLGGLAEEVIVDEKDIWLMPGNIDFVKAAGLTDSFGTAFLGMVKSGHLSEKQTALVTMAPSHGYAPLDLAANVYKAKVIAMSMTEDETQNLRERGAWSSLAFDEKLLKNIIKDLTNSKGVNVIYDTLAGEILHTCFSCVSQGGHIVVAGFTLNELPAVKMMTLLNLPSFCITAASLWSCRNHAFQDYRDVISEVIEMSEQSLISPYIAAKFELEKINDAVKLIKDKQPIGKVIITMDS